PGSPCDRPGGDRDRTARARGGGGGGAARGGARRGPRSRVSYLARGDPARDAGRLTGGGPPEARFASPSPERTGPSHSSAHGLLGERCRPGVGGRASLRGGKFAAGPLPPQPTRPPAARGR